MSLNMLLCGVLGGVLAVFYVGYKLQRASREIDRLFKINEQLTREKATSETQVKHFKERKHNEENSRNLDRTALIERMQKSGDLRD